MSIPLPRLLDKTMHEVRRLNPTKVSITLMLTPLSTASMTLPNGEPAISVGDFIELFIPSGSAGIFRVSKASTDYMTGKQNINLEHGIVTLSDATVFGKHQFFGYDEGGDEDTTITGFISTFTLHYTSGRLEVAEMGAHNDDGSHYGVSFLNTLGIVPIVTKGDSGWVTVLNQSVFDQASSISGTWDGVVRSSTLSTNLGCICRPYSNATGTIVKSESLYDNPRVGGMYISPRMVYPGQRVFVLGDCNYKAAYFQEKNGQSLRQRTEAEDM